MCEVGKLEDKTMKKPINHDTVYARYGSDTRLCDRHRPNSCVRCSGRGELVTYHNEGVSPAVGMITCRKCNGTGQRRLKCSHPGCFGESLNIWLTGHRTKHATAFSQPQFPAITARVAGLDTAEQITTQAPPQAGRKELNEQPHWNLHDYWKQHMVRPHLVPSWRPQVGRLRLQLNPQPIARRTVQAVQNRSAVSPGRGGILLQRRADAGRPIA